MRFSIRKIAFSLAVVGLAATLASYGPPKQTRAQSRVIKRLRQWERRHKTSPGARADSPQEAQDFFVTQRVPGGSGPLDYGLYTPAIFQMQQNPGYVGPGQAIGRSSGPVNSWSFLGPGNVGGRTRALIIDPTNSSVMYAAAVAGGVWKSTNGGTSWAPTADFIANIAVNSLAMDPTNHNVLYAGTGEGYFNGDSARGNGIFKTTDGGATWNQLAFTNSNSDFFYVNKIAINATASRIYAATRTGVFRSIDGGSTWTKTLDAAAINGCMDVKVQTDRPLARVFAACGTFQAITTNGFIARAADGSGAQSWSSVLSPANMGRTSLALAPSNQNVIYALAASNTNTGNYQQGLLAVYRSGDGGTSWTTQVSNTNPTLLNTLLLTNPIEAELTQCGFGTSTFAFTQGWYDNIITVDPTNPNVVWVGGIDLFRSTDAGQNWGVASYWWVGGAPADPEFAHADQHAIVFDPNYNGSTNQKMYVGNDGGIFLTNNATTGNVGFQANICAAYGAGGTQYATNPVTWTNLNNNYGVTQFYYGVPFPDGTVYFGGTQDNGTPASTDGLGPNNWVTLLSGDGGAVAVNPGNTNQLWAENTNLSIQKSTNGGASFAGFTSGITESSGNFLFIAPFVQDPSNANNMWTGGARLWRTTTATTSASGGWVQASVFLGQRVSAIAVAPTDSNVVYAAGSNGGPASLTGTIYHNTTALTASSTTTWASSNPRPGAVPSALAVDPTDSNTVWVTYSTFGGSHVFKSTNTGNSWTPMPGTGANSIPDIPVNAVAINPSDRNKIYLGTDLGVYASVDGGVNWLVVNSGQLPNVIVDALVFNRTGTIQLFAFTHGRGAWKVTPN
jgi:hypothetical protein